MASRCVECGYPKTSHAAFGRCPGGKTQFASMDLPAGKTCEDCVHFKRTCSWLLSYSGKETSCDWFPIKSQEAQTDA